MERTRRINGIHARPIWSRSAKRTDATHCDDVFVDDRLRVAEVNGAER